MENKLPSRKQIRLKNYDYTQCGSYYITICVNNKMKLFELGNNATAPQNLLLKKRIRELCNKFQIEIDIYAIMPNHIHILITFLKQQSGCDIQRVVQWFKTMTTNDYISSVKQSVLPPFEKHLWQKSYYEHVVRNDEDYANIYEYIKNNPLKWKLDNYY